MGMLGAKQRYKKELCRIGVSDANSCWEFFAIVLCRNSFAFRWHVREQGKSVAFLPWQRISLHEGEASLEAEESPLLMLNGPIRGNDASLHNAIHEMSTLRHPDLGSTRESDMPHEARVY